MKKSALSSLVAIGVGTGVAGATVFIMPTDVDQYKAKTDQTFYDTYQSDTSMIAGGANPKAKKILEDSGIKTSNKVMEGYILERPNTTILAGTTLRAGAEPIKFRLPIAGSDLYTLSSDKKTGKAMIQGRGAAGATITLEGVDALQKGRQYCISSGKSGCSVFAQDRTNVYYNAYSGELRRDRVQYSAAGVSCGKYGDCRAPAESAFSPNNLKGSKSTFYSVDDLYKKRYSRINDVWPKGEKPKDYSSGESGGNGKYSS